MHRKLIAKSNAFVRLYDSCNKNDNPFFLKYKKIFNKLVEERRKEILKLSKNYNYDDLT